MYYPTEDSMDSKQAAFYKAVEASLRRGEHIDIEGQIGYVFVYLYKLLSNWNKQGFESLSEFLIYLSEIYKYEDKLYFYCLHWAHDCLLGLKKYENFLEKTEPKNPFGQSTHASNLRLNIQRKIGVEANPIDVLLMSGGRKSKFITENQAIYKEKIRDVFLSFSQERGGWFSIFEEWNHSKELYPHYLFSGAVVPKNPEMEFKIYAYYSIASKFNLIDDIAKEAENQARKEAGIPGIGEGWVSETELFRKLEAEFSTTTVIQHGQPKWLDVEFQ
jgi:hypothetical protein